VASDHYSWHGTGWGTGAGKAGFELARQITGSHVEDVDIDVMDLSPEPSPPDAASRRAHHLEIRCWRRSVWPGGARLPLTAGDGRVRSAGRRVLSRPQLNGDLTNRWTEYSAVHGMPQCSDSVGCARYPALGAYRLGGQSHALKGGARSARRIGRSGTSRLERP
jgi:hypothetical protein